MLKTGRLTLLLILFQSSICSLRAEPLTVTGQLVDLACYVVDKANTGNAHKGKGKNCSRACATEGFPVGVLTEDGKVYHLTGELTAQSNAKLISHMGAVVTVTGEVKTEDGQLFLAATELKEKAH